MPLKLHHLQEPPPAWLGEALERFEQQFQYPLGTTQRFRISHGRDYLPFFQAMGNASVLVVERDDEVQGTLARVERWIDHCGAKPMRQLVHYLCDLKVAPTARGSRVLPLLMQETRRQVEASRSRSCYAIVMGGTGRLPTDYTGRIGIPGFDKLAEIMVLRVSSGTKTQGHPVVTSGLPDSESTVRITGGQHALRSLMVPLSLSEAQDASGVLEDTRRGKRLWIEGAGELLSAHLSNLHFTRTDSAATLLHRALTEVQRSGFQAFFTALPASAWMELRPALGGLDVQEAPASIYGHQLPANSDWWVDTAEI